MENTPESPTHELAAALNQFVNIHVVQSKQGKRQGGLGKNELKILELLSASGTLTFTDIAQTLGLKPAEVWRLRMSLEERKKQPFIKTKVNERDARVRDVHITGRGIRKLDSLNDHGIDRLTEGVQKIAGTIDILTTTAVVRGLIESLAQDMDLLNGREMTDVATELAEALQALKTVSVLQPKKTAEKGLTQLHRSVLELLDTKGVTNVGDIARILGLNFAHTSNIVGPLEEWKPDALLISKRNKDDKRKMDVEISDAGRSTLARLREGEVARLSSGLEQIPGIGGQDLAAPIKLIRALIAEVTQKQVS